MAKPIHHAPPPGGKRPAPPDGPLRRLGGRGLGLWIGCLALASAASVWAEPTPAPADAPATSAAPVEEAPPPPPPPPLEVPAASVLPLGGAGEPLPAVAESPTERKPLTPAKPVVLSDALTKPDQWLVGKKERVLQEVKRAVETKTPASGARNALAGKKLEEMDVSSAVSTTLKRHLSLAQERRKVAAAQHAVALKQSVYDPTINFSLTQNRVRSYERSDDITRERENPANFNDTIQEGDIITLEDGSSYTVPAGSDYIGKNYSEVSMAMNSADSTVGCIIVNDIAQGPNCTNAIVNNTRREYASSRSRGWTESWNGSLGLGKSFFWGGSAYATLTTNYSPYEYYSKSADVAAGRAFDMGVREWSSSMSLGFSTPLPYTKNFGSLGNWAAVDEALAQLDEERAARQEETLANSVLEMVLTGYWELVRQTLHLSAAMERREYLDAQTTHAQRMSAEDKITAYSLIQVQAETANAQHQEEIAWQNWYSKGAELATLLDLPQETILFPGDFGGWPTPKGHEPKALEESLAHRPDLKARQSALNANDLLLKHQAQQLGWDVSFNMNYNLGESTAVYAYDDLWESWKGLRHPDSRNYYLGFTLTHALGDKAAEAAHATALSQRDRTLDDYQAARVTAARELEDASAAVRGAQNRMRLTAANLSLTAEARENAGRLWEEGLLTEFDLLMRERDIFEARQAVIDARIDLAAAQARRMGAEGVLGERLFRGGESWSTFIASVGGEP
ncbi:MAG: TolC family protein [Magnetococcales bacterium]|nr:TolC family protein [Magnetococcales bacterium]